MYEFSWYENNTKKHKLVSKEDHAKFWQHLNQQLKENKIKFPFCIFRKN